jgi:hypothetical protein
MAEGQLPIIEQIAANILDTISGITEAAGFNYTLTAERHLKSGNIREHLKAVIYQEDPEPQPDRVYFTKEWIQPFVVGVYISPPETDLTPMDQYKNIIAADVTKAIMADIYRGGLALRTTIRAYASFATENNEEWEGIAIAIAVQYRTVETDPFTRA